MFVHNLKNGIGVYAGVALLTCFGCVATDNSQMPKEQPQIEATSLDLITTGVPRPMPFLPGQRAGISQGNFGTASHTVARGLQYAVDFTVSDDAQGHMSRGMPVVATNDGYVSEATYGNKDITTDCNRGWGNSVVYCSGFRIGPCERAGHLREVFVKVGDFVHQGQVIGLIGNSGNSDGAHLHAQQQPFTSCGSDPDPDQQTVCGSSSYAEYVYKATKDGSPLTEHFQDSAWDAHYSSNYTNPITLSTNEGVIGHKSGLYTTAQIGSPTSPRNTSDMGLNEGWNGYGWHDHYVGCIANTNNNNKRDRPLC